MEQNFSLGKSAKAARASVARKASKLKEKVLSEKTQKRLHELAEKAKAGAKKVKGAAKSAAQKVKKAADSKGVNELGKRLAGAGEVVGSILSQLPHNSGASQNLGQPKVW